MFAALIAAAALSLDTPAAVDCSAGARAECVALMETLYRSADAQTGEAVRMRGAERWRASPRFLVRLEGERVLIVQNARDGLGYHAQAGSWSAYYFAAAEPRLTRAARDFRASGSFGHPGAASLVFIEGAPALFVAAGGTWQGESCRWASVDLLGADRPQELLEPFLLAYSDASGNGGRALSAEIESLSLTSAAVTYSDGARFTFSPQGAGPMRPNAETPRRC